MSVDAGMVKELRMKTGAGIMACKEALKECDGDIENASVYLRKKGIAKADKKSSRDTSEGSIFSYIHQGGKIGVMVEINCETDFVARNEKFQELCKDVCMHIAAASPQFVRREDVSQDLLDKEREIFTHQAKESGKPENVVQKIVDGKIDKYYSEICLLEQKFVKNPDFSIDHLIKDKIAELGENIGVKRFVKYTLGE